MKIPSYDRLTLLPYTGRMDAQYHAFLLRLQRHETAEHWRMTLENAHTGEKVHFATEEELMRYLWHIVGEGRLFLPNPLTQSDPSDGAKPVNS